MKKKSTEQEKIFANDMTDKGLISHIYKLYVQLMLKLKKLKNQMEELNRHFSKKEMQRGQQAHEKMLNHHRNENQNHNEYHLTPIIKKNITDKCW